MPSQPTVSIDEKEVSVIPGTRADEQRLLAFYEKKYPYRIGFLRKHWRWLYRTAFVDDALPRAIVYRNQVIGQASGMPFLTEIAGEKYRAQWYIDFAVDSDFRGNGLGVLISKDYVRQGDIHLAVPMNAASTHIFTKLGWELYDSSEMHFLLIHPANHPKVRDRIPSLLRRPLNALARFFYRQWYGAKAFPRERIRVQQLDRENIEDFVQSQRKGENIVAVYRDKDYLEWRFLNSPDLPYYRHFSIAGTDMAAIVKIQENKVENMIFREPLDDAAFIRLMASIAAWAAGNRYDYVTNYTTVKERSEAMQRNLLTVKSHKIYAYYSKDENLQAFLRQARHYWDFADSDFERFSTDG